MGHSIREGCCASLYSFCSTQAFTSKGSELAQPLWNSLLSSRHCKFTYSVIRILRRRVELGMPPEGAAWQRARLKSCTSYIIHSHMVTMCFCTSR